LVNYYGRNQRAIVLSFFRIGSKYSAKINI
jgi:hypothetical protein